MAHRTWTLAEERASFVYDVLTNLVVPRPIAFVSSLNSRGQANLAPFSYFMLGGLNPPSLAFSPILDLDGKKKTTLANVEETGEYTVNLLTRELAERMNLTGVDYGEGSNKWGISGLTGERSLAVAPDRVAECPVQFECRAFQIVPHGSGPSSAHYVIGEVLVAHIEETLLPQEGKGWGPFEPIARLGGAGYLDLEGGKVFQMPRPKPPVPPSEH